MNARRRQASEEPSHDRGRLDFTRVRKQHRELVSAEARDEVALAQDAAEAGRNVLQQSVADVVAHRVVDVLEPVEIDQRERDGLAGASRGLHHLGQAVVQKGAIRQTGERVVKSQML